MLWLRLPRLLCLFRVIMRRIRYAGRSRPDMTEGCPEKVDLEFLSYIWNFEKEDGLKIRDALARHGPDVPVFILDFAW